MGGLISAMRWNFEIDNVGAGLAARRATRVAC